jgi:hypothetical protein
MLQNEVKYGVEAVYNTSTIALGVVESDEKETYCPEE